MDYIELECSIQENNEEARDILVAELNKLGYDSFQEYQNGIKAYIRQDRFIKNIYKNIFCVKKKIFGEILFKYKLYKDKNWNEYWEKNFQPVIVNDQLLIKAPFHNIKKKYKYEIILEPKMSFGTGHHATTWMMLAALIDLNIDEKDVLDIGCGTGILSIFASIKGAKQVIGIDNNNWAYFNSLENIKINKVSNVDIQLGEIASLELHQKFDLVMANINLNVIINEMPEYIRLLKSNGVILFCGILSENQTTVHHKALKNNLKIIETREKGDWILLKYTRK